MDALAAGEAAIEAEMAKFDETTRKAMDETVTEYNRGAIYAVKRLQRPGQLQRRVLMARENWKNELWPLVVDTYHLNPEAEQTAQSAVIINLLKDSLFLFDNHGQDFLAPIVWAAFKILHKRVVPQRLLKRVITLKLESSALITTALECCLDEWKSGQRVHLTFTTGPYQGRYWVDLESIRPFMMPEGGH
ncbi:hypothetical protein C8J56DRAFT_1020228 [Mycena floridula]|nr:hypothetical protein C8J56DRAFT_1020228 [Mycena floridula]